MDTAVDPVEVESCCRPSQAEPSQTFPHTVSVVEATASCSHTIIASSSPSVTCNTSATCLVLVDETSTTVGAVATVWYQSMAKARLEPTAES
ncbi:unannotated protein [freshwater metagenome]|uniref:Unannotated protein n=1 Tax=freshwater metagenome TaxID=449393 RepID=A0A6J6GUS6_9ZZZZ